jgi:hypothetical protein
VPWLPDVLWFAVPFGVSAAYLTRFVERLANKAWSEWLFKWHLEKEMQDQIEKTIQQTENASAAEKER